MIRAAFLIPVLLLSACSGSNAPLSGSASCATANAADPAAALSGTAKHRADLGLGALRRDARLDRIAQDQACHMAATGVMSHSGPRGEAPSVRAKGVGYRFSALAENVAAGYETSDQALAGWLRSPAHRANIENPHVRDVGIGSAMGDDGTVYWAAVYGKEL